MKPAPFRMERPGSIEEALELLAAHAGDARPLAGGQSLVPMMNLRLARPSVVVDLNRIAALAGVRLDEGWLKIGAMTRQQALLENPLVQAHAPLIGKALSHVGHLQTRSRGTIGGSLAHADPAAELATALVAAGATLVLRSGAGVRSVEAREFFLDAMTTALADGELIVEVRCRPVAAGTRASFHEFSRRHGDFAIAAAGVQKMPLAEGRCAIAAAVGGVQTVPHFCRRLAALAWPADAAPADFHAVIDEEMDELEPLTDLQSDGPQRLALGRQALLRCLAEVLA